MAEAEQLANKIGLIFIFVKKIISQWYNLGILVNGSFVCLGSL